MKIDFLDAPRLTLHGYSPETPADILARVKFGAAASDFKGDFILVAEGRDRATKRQQTVFVSTPIAAVPYYFHISSRQCFHAANVFDCCREARLRWDWNWDALAQLATFDHLIGNASLHAQIEKVPPCCVMKVTGGVKEVKNEPFWRTIFQPDPGADASGGAAVISSILAELPTSVGCALALSAGYDSRVLLAGLLSRGIPPVTASMGTSESTDPRIAKQMADAYQLPFERVSLAEEDYERFASDIILTTSGEKTFWHWHTGIFTYKVGFSPAALLLAGSNGEFARSYYCDSVLTARALDSLSLDLWRVYLARKFPAQRSLDPNLIDRLSQSGPFRARLNSRVLLQSSTIPSGLPFGQALDCFYASERVRNFIGLGLALYRSRFTTMSPFLDVRFLRFAGTLRRSQKLSNRVPVETIRELHSPLLNYAVDDSGVTMGGKKSHLFQRGHGAMTGYNRYMDSFRRESVVTWAHKGLQEIGGRGKLDIDIRSRYVHGMHFLVTIGALSSFLSAQGLYCEDG